MAEKKVKCPVCGERFELEEDLEVGNTTYCSGCYTDLKIVKLDPIQVEEVREDTSDYSDKDEEEDSEY